MIQSIQSADGTTLAVQTRTGKSPGLLFCNGYASDMEGTKATRLFQLAEKLNHAAVLFDYRGHGKSHGNFENSTIGNWIEDTLAVLTFAAKTLAHKWILIGSSMGAWMAIKALLKKPQQIHAMILVSPAPDFPKNLLLPDFPKQEKIKLQQGKTARWIEEPKTPPQGYLLTQEFLDDAQTHHILEGNSTIPCPVPLRTLIGMKDEVVPMQYMLNCFQRLDSSDATATIFKTGDHRLSNEKQLRELEIKTLELIEYSHEEKKV